MGSPTPSTPGSLPPRPAVRVSAVMAGQEWLDPNGAAHLAASDVVMIELLDTADGYPIAVLTQPPDAAISLARLIQNKAVELINSEVTDAGAKLSLSARLSRINAAHSGARA